MWTAQGWKAKKGGKLGDRVRRYTNADINPCVIAFNITMGPYYPR